MNEYIKRVGLVCFLSFTWISVHLFGQYQLDLVYEKDEDKKIFDASDYQATHSDSSSVFFEMKSIVTKLRSDSYLEASIDSYNRSDSTYTAQLHIGPSYEFVFLKTGNIDPEFISRVGFREINYSKRLFNVQEVNALMDQILVVFENSGYPFAQVKFNKLNILDGQIEAELYVKKGTYFVYDELNLNGNAELSRTYLEKYLEIEEGEAYNQEKILAIRKRIQDLPFVELRSNPTISFRGTKAVVNLPLDKRKASRFDFLIGILPQTENGSSNLTITGQFTADMYNKLGRGEHFFLDFQRLRPETQELDVQFNYPYVVDLPFGIDTRFRLFRSANDFLEIDVNAGLQYLFSGIDYVKFFWNTNNYRLLDLDTAVIRQQGRLPQQLDINYSGGGVELSVERLDYRFNPRKGFKLLFSGIFGFKSIVRNNQILSIESDEVDFSMIYDSLNLKTYQFKLNALADYYIPLQQRGAIKLSASAGIKLAEEDVFQNEFFRIGGYRLLRGFDEESIFAQFYSVFTLEYRLIIARNSYISVFGDYAILRNKFNLNQEWDRPYGFGGGINFDTSSGVFGVSAAVGSQLGNPVDFRNVKVHFGYISLF